jgi:diguanylate cyclase (GGDEF)-like protein/PAS domain S-box-containing protein
LFVLIEPLSEPSGIAIPLGQAHVSELGEILWANDTLVHWLGAASLSELLQANAYVMRDWAVQAPRWGDLITALQTHNPVALTQLVRRPGSPDDPAARRWVRLLTHARSASAAQTSSGIDLLVHDITDERLFRSVVERLPVMIAARDPDGVNRYANPATLDVLGIAPEQYVGTAPADWVHPDDVARARAEGQRNDRGNGLGLESLFRMGDARTGWRPVAVRGVPALDDPAVRGVIGMARALSAAEQAGASKQGGDALWKLALDTVGDGVWDWYPQAKIETLSARCLEMYGYTAAEVDAMPGGLDAVTHPDDLAAMREARQEHFAGRTPSYVNEHRVKTKSGDYKWVLSRGMVIERDAQGQPLRVVGTHTDITSRKQSEELVWAQANYDGLTGLPNRMHLRERLQQDMLRCQRADQPLTLLFLDLDGFKEVNDTLGHASGDLLLIEAAHRLRECVRATDTLARLGGDEFTIVLPDMGYGPALERVLADLLAALNRGFVLGSEQVFVSCSIGATLYPNDGDDVQTLFRNADQALYAAKEAGRNRFSYFTAALQDAAQARLRLSVDLRSAMAERQFSVVYQPIVELATGFIGKAEALLRWQHPQRGAVSPAEFIPAAESMGLINELGEWVLQEACAQVRAWRQDIHPGFQISVNRSPVQFRDTHAPQGTTGWAERLAQLGVTGQALALEITEGLLLDNSPEVRATLLALRDCGVAVALDDFGTGFSSLTYLQKFDIDFIKIDRSFVHDLAPGNTSMSLCKAIIVMAHELGIRVVAEGVETAQQRQLLTAAGCDFAQGYHFSRPLPAAQLTAWMQQLSASSPPATLATPAHRPP